MQTPASILLHLDSSERVAERIRLACTLAEAFDARVTAQACSTPAPARYPYVPEYAAGALAVLERLHREARDRIHEVFVRHADGSSRVQWAEPLEEGPRAFIRRALYADLLVLGQRDPQDPMVGELPAGFLADLLMHSGKPALVLPWAGAWPVVGRNVLIAWKETREAARAVSAALPWLRRAKEVHAVSYGPDAEPALRDLQDSLRLRGVAAMTLHPGGPKEDDVGNELLSRAAGLGTDLLVMGCYGHSRAREWVMGGATLAMLQWMTTPVLMSH